MSLPVAATLAERRDRRGDPEVIERRRRSFYGGMSREDFFWARVEKTARDGCWLWHGNVDISGYGRLGHTLAHRLAYMFALGAIESGLVLDHLCRTKLCVNPNHLEPVSAAENARREQAARVPVFAARTRCMRDLHELPPFIPGRPRRCYRCDRARRAATGTYRLYRERKKAERCSP